jgi:hypothetical protein
MLKHYLAHLASQTRLTLYSKSSVISKRSGWIECLHPASPQKELPAPRAGKRQTRTLTPAPAFWKNGASGSLIDGRSAPVPEPSLHNAAMGTVLQ